MKIMITENKGEFVADDVSLPGSPPIGNGSSREMAVASLFMRLIYEKWDLDLTELTINGEKYKSKRG